MLYFTVRKQHKSRTRESRPLSSYTTPLVEFKIHLLFEIAVHESQSGFFCQKDDKKDVKTHRNIRQIHGQPEDIAAEKQAAKS